MATRYNSYDSRSSTSSFLSDPCSSIEFKKPQKPSSASRAIVTKQPVKAANTNNLTSMVKKFMEKKSSSAGGLVKAKGCSANQGLVIPVDFIAEDLKKTARKGGNFGGLQRKLFGNKVEKKSSSEKTTKALVEVKGGSHNANTRTLAMVLRSERELLNANKDLEMEISQLKVLIQEKNNEVMIVIFIA